MSSGGWGGGFGGGFGGKKRQHEETETLDPTLASKMASTRPAAAAAPSAKRQRPPEAAARVGGPMAVADVFREAMNGVVAAVAAALDADASLLERPQVGGIFDSRRLLHGAAARGHEGVVRLLLARGADAGAVDKRGATAASLAAKQGHAQVAALLEAGSNAGGAGTSQPMAVQTTTGGSAAAAAPAAAALLEAGAGGAEGAGFSYADFKRRRSETTAAEDDTAAAAAAGAGGGGIMRFGPPAGSGSAPPAAAAAAAAAAADDGEAGESDGPQYSDAELLNTSGSAGAGAEEGEGGGAQDEGEAEGEAGVEAHAADIYDILGEEVDDDLLL